ncbi:DASH complex, subunit Dad2 [Saitoella complicata NRRL Y-17804]|uniref:DASH complex, subunit Dad2 n=1 Tax=Saitoella complicata (strain BCRC 22490 / CBS 7301 / JCM 7358 / NBRC 10748 / NRRL Y-17804) TaxID=698492 RepID=UPI0008676654|nr:DASH complex, subunit Dad2 [Saitoella complicata NRRL Y-17804]ODQ51363.1 DASH complex, subunit Dad2 [Saitoella complicata NRRL Y-17804]
MSYNPHARSAYASANPALAARLAEKQREYENLLQLRDLSAGLAAQMEQLEGKLETLTNGTEAVATVLANWQNVFRAINLSAGL